MPEPNFEPVGNAKHIFAGIFGDPGIGKSRLVGTTPCVGDKPNLVIRPPQEHLNSWLPADQKRAADGEWEQLVIHDWDEANLLLEWAREEGARFGWIWLDNATIMFDVLLDDIWDSVKTAKPARDQKHLGLDQGEYGRNMERYSRWLRHMVGPDKFNFGFTAHAEVAASPDKDRDGDPIEKLMPYIQGKGMPTRFASYTNLLGYYHQAQIGDNTRRVLRTDSSPNYYAKDHFDALGGRMIEPTMPQIIEAIKSKRGGRQPASRPSTTTRTAGAPRRVVRRSR